MANDSLQGGGTSLSRVLGTGIGIFFLLFNLWMFREHYLLKNEGISVQGNVTHLGVMRRRGGISYNVDYVFELSGHRYEGEGQVSQASFSTLRPDGPITVRYASSQPSLSETAEMSHDNVSLFLTTFLGLPAGLFILGINLRKPRQAAEFSLEPEQEESLAAAHVQMPNQIKGIAFTMYPVMDMKRARKFYEEDLGLKAIRDFRGEWIEYHLWDNCFAITTMAGPAVTPSADAGGSIAFEVQNVDDFVDRLRKKGTPIKVEPFSTPGCRMAVVVDTEGNALTLHQRSVSNSPIKI